MKRHPQLRLTSGAIALTALLLAGPHPAAAQTAPAPTRAAAPGPTLDERLERLAAAFERNRIDMHVPGAALVVVRGDKVIFARGFGAADLGDKAPLMFETPVTLDTRFFIGSTTKAFTAMLTGMLVDDGRMQWDDPVDKFLPAFKLAVKSDDPADRATIRDLLSHRTGFMSPGILQANIGLTPGEILRRAATAESVAPFRKAFHYNNVQFLAVGQAAAAATGSSWETLVKSRILDPLGMTATQTSMRATWHAPLTAKGYAWDKTQQSFRRVELNRLGFNIDGIAPAGNISSTPRDMGTWLRFLLRKGAWKGKSLVKPATFDTMLTPQIQMAPGVGYGLGWTVRNWQGQKLISHGGDVPGFSTSVGLLPESDIGFVVLSNAMSTLPTIMANEVPRYLLGELPPAAPDRRTLERYAGRYVSRFGPFANEVLTVSDRDGRLWLDIPGRLSSPLDPPGADGRWPVVIGKGIALSFDREGGDKAPGLKFHEGATFMVPREGIAAAPEVPSETLGKYVGRYRDAAGKVEFAMSVRDRRLAVRLPGDTIFDLRAPDANGRWATRDELGIGFSFEQAADGTVSALTVHRPVALPALRLTPVAAALPSVDEVMKLRRVAAPTATVVRTSGKIRFPQSGVEGQFTTWAAGDDRQRLDMQFDVPMKMQSVVNGRRGWLATSGGTDETMTGAQLEQMRLGHPAILFGDWRRYYDSVEVVRSAELDGRKVYVVQLDSAGLPPALVSVDAQTGDILQVQQKIVSAAGMLPSTTRYSDYREVGGQRVPHHMTQTDMGTWIFEVERVEIGVEPPRGTFERPRS